MEIRAAAMGGRLIERPVVYENELTAYQLENRDKLVLDTQTGQIVVKERWEITEAEHQDQMMWEHEGGGGQHEGGGGRGVGARAAADEKPVYPTPKVPLPG